MEAREIAREFIIHYFNVRGDFFDTAWDFVNANFGKISSLASSSQGIKSIGGPLAFGGDEEQGAVKAILIFADGFREMPLKSDMSDFVDSVRTACGKYHAEARLTEEILKKVTSLENRIAKFMKPELPTGAVAKGKEEKADYELLSSGKKKKFLLAEKAENIRDNKSSGIFIDDERKEIFFNKKMIDEFQGQMYSMLKHFVMNEGVGGDKERIYEEVWQDKTGAVAEDSMSGAVDTTISRFRSILKKHKICDVETRSEGVFSSRKIYVLKPMSSYCILRRIENKNEG
jgi:hypothetical protein